jgi:hypothetical protein
MIYEIRGGNDIWAGKRAGDDIWAGKRAGDER